MAPTSPALPSGRSGTGCSALKVTRPRCPAVSCPASRTWTSLVRCSRRPATAWPVPNPLGQPGIRPGGKASELGERADPQPNLADLDCAQMGRGQDGWPGLGASSGRLAAARLGPVPQPARHASDLVSDRADAGAAGP